MNNSFISKIFENAKAVITARNEREAREEDPRIYDRLKDHLCIKNAHRSFVMCIFVFIMGIIEMITDSGTLFGIIGTVMLLLVSVVFFGSLYKFSTGRSVKIKSVRMLTYLFWALFSASVLLVCISHVIQAKFPYAAAAYIIIMMMFPIMNIYESAVFTAFTVVLGLVCGLGLKLGLAFWMTALLIAVGTIWIPAIVRCCYADLWLGERRIETTEERCELISQKDSLTGLLNKAGLSAKFSELAGQYGAEKTISVILIDIDNFRAFNHIYGYDKSDECLYRVCNCIKIVAKPYTELVSRFGGDDFVLIFENMSELDVVKLAEQLRESVEQMAQTFGDGIVTVSVGVSGTADLVGKQTYSELLKDADDQLMIAKNAGRNCIGFKGMAYKHKG